MDEVMPRKERSVAGMTLIELVIGLAIIIIVIGTGFTLLFQGYKSHNFSERMFSVQTDVRNASQFISDTIRNADEVLVNNDLSQVGFSSLDATIVQGRFDKVNNISFTLVKPEFTSNKYMVEYRIVGKENEGGYTYEITSSVLLNNFKPITAIATPVVGNSLHYK